MKGLKSRKKIASNDEMVQKKRRNVKGFGCMGEMNRGCCDVKLGWSEIEEIVTRDAGMGDLNVTKF